MKREEGKEGGGFREGEGGRGEGRHVGRQG